MDSSNNHQHAHHSHKKTYIAVFVLLAVLTAVEIAIPAVGLPKLQSGILLTVLAAGKAFFVGYYFMHLNEEKPWLKFIALVPVSAAIYATILCLETIYR